jgi:hypothetical protein
VLGGPIVPAVLGDQLAPHQRPVRFDATDVAMGVSMVMVMVAIGQRNADDVGMGPAPSDGEVSEMIQPVGVRAASVAAASSARRWARDRSAGCSTTVASGTALMGPPTTTWWGRSVCEMMLSSARLGGVSASISTATRSSPNGGMR